MQTKPQVNDKPNALKVKWITTFDGFIALKQDWNKLAQHYPDHFFYRHEWFESAFAWARLDSKLNILCAFVNDQLIAILPLCIKQAQYKGLPYRLAEFLTVPDTQMCDLIIAPDFQALSGKVFQHLLNHRCWDKLRLHYLEPNSHISKLNNQLNLDGIFLATTKHSMVDMGSSWEAYYQTRSRRLKKGNNHCRNQLQKQGDIRVENISYMPNDGILNIIKNISQNSWKKKTKTTFDQAGPYAFISELISTAKQNHWLNLWVLKLNEKAIAYELQIEFNQTVYALRSDYLKEYAELSPGSYLNWQILQRLFEDKQKRYCMGPGENAYKQRWENQQKQIYTFSLYQSTMIGRITKTIEQRVAPKIRPIKSSLETLLKKHTKTEEVQ